jgi:hypothetical protein
MPYTLGLIAPQLRCDVSPITKPYVDKLLLPQVDFRALDEHTIKPLAIYGSILSIADFLAELNVIDQET